MKKICIFVLLLYFVTILFGCANKEDKLANGDDSVLEPPETNSLSVDYVAFFRENICRPYLLTGIEINTEDDKHDAGEVVIYAVSIPIFCAKTVWIWRRRCWLQKIWLLWMYTI